jgi:hypothetical protein
MCQPESSNSQGRVVGSDKPAVVEDSLAAGDHSWAVVVVARKVAEAAELVVAVGPQEEAVVEGELVAPPHRG